MSIEFVDPAPPVRPADHPGHADGAHPCPHDHPDHTAGLRPVSAVLGRLLALVWAAAATLTALSVVPSLYAQRRTSFVVDFDRTTHQVFEVDVDAFGHVHQVSPGELLTFADDPNYAVFWLVLAGLLAAVAAWSLWRPTSVRPPVVAAVLGAAVLGSLATIWLGLHGASGVVGPNMRVDDIPAGGFWLAVGGGLLAAVAGTVVTLARGHALRRAVRWRAATPAGVELL